MKYKPKNINSLDDYRTRRSIKNQDVWQIDINICVKYLFQVSLAITIFHAFGIVSGNKDTGYILNSYIFLLITLGAIIWKIEARINQLFDKQGKRLNNEQ
jgi:hypothetical protein